MDAMHSIAVLTDQPMTLIGTAADRFSAYLDACLHLGAVTDSYDGGASDERDIDAAHDRLTTSLADFRREVAGLPLRAGWEWGGHRWRFGRHAGVVREP